jgi:hypothetical protein
MKPIPIYKQFSKKELEIKISEVDNFRQFVLSLGYKVNTGTLASKLKKYLIEIDVDITKLAPTLPRRTEAYSKEEILSKFSKIDKLINGPTLKKWIKKFDLKVHSGSEEKCSLCPQTNFWNSIPLILQLDHINGDNTDNSLENLRFICPNCHTQTDTFCGKSTKKDKQCLDCQTKISFKSIRCQSCAAKISNIKKFEVSEEQLYDLVCNQKISFVKLAKMFDVSDNAIRNRCISFQIDPKTRQKML